MKINQNEIDKVNLILNKQHALLSSLCISLWAIPILIFWYFLDTKYPEFTTIMLIVSGIISGLVIRFHGRGTTAQFSIIAFISHVWICLIAFDMNMVIHGEIWGFILFLFYFFGAYGAISLARIDIPFELHRAHSWLNSKNKHESNNLLKNKWYITMPVLFVFMGITSICTEIILLNYKESLIEFSIFEKKVQEKSILNNREISFEPKELEQRTTKEILRYVYAYHIGLLFNPKGTIGEPYIVSPYKRDTLLKYLINSRNNPRAKFIFAVMTNNQTLLNDAAKQGDKYAKIYSLLYLMCIEKSSLAKTQLESLKKIYNEPYLQSELHSVLYNGCLDVNNFELTISYIKNYYEKPMK